METFTFILGIVMLTCSVFQIMLFFKIWQMANNVKEIKKTFESFHCKTAETTVEPWKSEDFHQETIIKETIQIKNENEIYTPKNHHYKVDDHVLHKHANLTMYLKENCGNKTWRCIDENGDEYFCPEEEFTPVSPKESSK